MEPRALIGQIVESVALHPVAHGFSALAHTAAESRDAVFPRAGSPTLFGADLRFCHQGVLDGVELGTVLARGASSPREFVVLLALLLASELAQLPGPGQEGAKRALHLLFLETHAQLPCLTVLRTLLDEEQRILLARTLAGAVAAADSISHAEHAVAAAWLASDSSPEVVSLSTPIAQLRDATAACATLSGRLEGELVGRRHGLLATMLFAFTGVLFLRALLVLLGRYLLGYRAPATLSLGHSKLELEVNPRLLGKPLRSLRAVVPFEQLAEVTREVRFGTLGTVSGLLALVLGTYLGMRLFLDGLRAPGMSLPLLGLGVAMIILGLLLDLGLASFDDRFKPRHRLIITTARGRQFPVSVSTPTEADQLLRCLSQGLNERAS